MSEIVDITVGVIQEEITISAVNNIGEITVNAVSNSEEINVTANTNLIQVNINTGPVSIINPQDYDLSQFTNTSSNPFVRQSTLSSYVPISRTLTINGTTLDLSADRSWTIPGATWGSITGTLAAQTDLQAALDSKVPTSRTLTINGTSYDLSADRSWTISTGITIGSTPIASGTVGRVLFQGAGNVVQQSSSLFWDATNNRLGIGTATPNSALEVVDTGASSFVAPARFLVPNNNVSGRVSQFYLGTSMTRLNSISWNFHYQGNGSTANYQSFGFNGIANPALAMFGTLNVGINTTTDAGFRLDVNGTARVSGNVELPNFSLILQSGISGFAGSGNILLGNNFNIRAMNSSNTGVMNLIKSTSGNNIEVGGGNHSNTFINPTLNSGQTVVVGDNVVVASAVLNVSSTTKGFLPPRMTTTERNAIASPAPGLMVYDTTLNALSSFNGTVWSTIGGSVAWGSITGTLSTQTDLQSALNARVPYTGATANVDLGEYELKAGQLSLDITPTGTAAVGTTRWNDAIGSSETTLKGGNVLLKNGVDLVARVVNKVTPNATLLKANYTAVRISGAQGQRLAVEYAQANSDLNSADTIGLVAEDIATNQEGFVITVGELLGVNTTGALQSETWADGDVLYLSPTTPGAVTNIKPTGATGHIVVLGYVIYSHAVNGKIYVKIMNGWELDELHNVYINPATLANGDTLIYDSSTSLWKNGAGGGGGGASIIKLASQTLAVGSWALVGSYYQLTFSNASITTNTRVDFTPDNASYNEVTTCGMLPQVDVAAGSCTFYSLFPPQSNIVGEITIFPTI